MSESENILLRRFVAASESKYEYAVKGMVGRR